jgi:hypothetical protein
MKKILVLLMCFVHLGVFAQSPKNKKQPAAIVVSYKYVVNGKEDADMGKLIMECQANSVKIYNVYSGKKFMPGVPVKSSYIHYDSLKTYQLADLKDGKRIASSVPFSQLSKTEATTDTAKILGKVCKKAKTIIRSNTIEIYYTDKFGLKGSPQTQMGPELGLILKIVRNGNFEIVAEKIEVKKGKDFVSLLPADLGQMLDPVAFQARLTESYITRLDIFNNQQICFGATINNPSDENAGEVYRYGGGTLVLKKVVIPFFDVPQTAIVELTERSIGDAYDRTGSVFIIPMDKKLSFLDGLKNSLDVLPAVNARNGKKYQGVIATDDYLPSLELMRFFTPFGIHHYNNQVKVQGLSWEDSVVYRQDVSHLMPRLQGETWIGVFVGNYDKGGHQVSLKLRFYPESTELSNQKPLKSWIYPLFNTTNIMEMGGQEYGTMFDKDSLTIQFSVPPGIKNLRMMYITTGHGGWGNGDEFQPKANKIYVDDKEVLNFIPWRTDCATHRKYNPASGNFWNGISSSDGSRSGWCPGTATNPLPVWLNDVKPGAHTMKIAIPQGLPEGGSFSAWNISGVLIGEIEDK